MTRRIGFIGVGTMGKFMATNLLRRHYPVTVFDLNPAPVEELREFGAEAAASATEAATARRRSERLNTSSMSLPVPRRPSCEARASAVVGLSD